MKRNLSFLLALLMLASALAACGGESAPTDDPALSTTAPTISTTASPVAEETEPAFDPYASLPADLSFGGRTVRILSRENAATKDEITVDDLNGEVINDAVFRRNQLVEERLAVEIENTKLSTSDNYAVTNRVKNNVLSQTDEFDVFMNSVYSSCYVTADNLYHNLYDCTYLDLNNPWWAQDFNRAISLGKGQYFATGAISLSLKRFLFVTFFNKRLCDEYELENLYQVVREGRWTYEYEYDTVTNLWRDLDGDNQKSDGDFFGLGMSPCVNIDAFWSAFDLPILAKDNDNWPVLALNMEKTQDALEKINKLIWENEGTFANPDRSEEGQFSGIEKKFAAGELVLADLRIISAETAYLRDMKDEYGIIPLPKYSEEQEKYYSYAHDQFTACGIPLTAKEEDLPFIGAFLEAMCAESYRTVAPAYYEIALKTKYASDEESGEMLDMIVDNFLVDGGVLYTKSLESIHQQLRKLVQSKSNSFAAVWKVYERLVTKRLEALCKGVEAIQ